MSAEQLHPETGARFLFERDAVSEDRATARYRASIYTTTERFEYLVEVELGGDHRVDAKGDRADSELEKRLDGFARQLARGAATKRADDVEPWPSRILRWRGPGRG